MGPGCRALEAESHPSSAACRPETQESPRVAAQPEGLRTARPVSAAGLHFIPAGTMSLQLPLLCAPPQPRLPASVSNPDRHREFRETSLWDGLAEDGHTHHAHAHTRAHTHTRVHARSSLFRSSLNGETSSLGPPTPS